MQHYWRAHLYHTSFLLAQPVYLAVRYFLGYEPFSSTRTTNLTIHSLVWLFIVNWISIPFFTSPLLRVPSPRGEKLLTGHFKWSSKPPTKIFENFINDSPNDGLLVIWGPLYLLNEVIPTRPDTLMEMMNSRNYDWEKPPMTRKFISSILGEGLTNVEGAKHKAMRRVLAPAFSGRQVRDLAPLFLTKGSALTDTMARLLTETDDGVLEVTRLTSRISLDIIGAAGVGMDFNTIEHEDSVLAKLYHEVMHPPAHFLAIDTLFPRFLTRPLMGRGFARIFEAQSELRAKVRGLLQEKMTQENIGASAQPRKDIMAGIMRSGDFSDDYLMGQLLTILAAGHDTGASALSWALLVLSQHPQIQDRLRAECEAQLAHIPSEEVTASLFDAETTPFLTAVCEETLRLFCPVPVTPRQAAVTTTLGGVTIPKGTQATISPWAINHSHALWGPDAHIFNPARWLADSSPRAPADGGATSPHAFNTFLHGPRSCIGQSFARLELKCLLAALVLRFSMEVAEPDQEVEIGGFITIKPADGLKLRLRDLKAE
ncbi:uncharacterized protein HMPREF1541_01967 [Cyphellophora europaea CBS 101466]|uniref:Cytochrome P450 n=1 Tax=Cyphellophora europaea (strain CBS 101466) TaxID=1220924 RepID=W2S4B2_CYPE1|nr:uncharacterized protein HMPREF1541_01967 [Cyphellophora europaea CBS 101466]ETN42809.1 hypothetical protein HMPREF1541_01967 [Cyphellophora europaea CBS 101466]